MGHELCHCLGREAPPLDKRAEEAEGGFCGVVLGFCGVSCVQPIRPARSESGERAEHAAWEKEKNGFGVCVSDEVLPASSSLGRTVV